MQHELPYSSSSAAPAAPAARSSRLSFPARLAQRVSLRPVLLFSSFISALYLFLVAASSFRRADDTETHANGLYTREIVPAILFLVAAAIEVLGFAGAITVRAVGGVALAAQRLPLARAYAYASLGGWGAIAAAQLYTIVTHYTLKNQVISACTARNTGAYAVDDSYWLWSSSNSSGHQLTADEARASCTDAWNRSKTTLIAALILSLALGALFVLFAFGFLRQLLDPSSVHMARGRTQVFENHQDPFAGPGATDPYDARRGPYSYPPAAGGVAAGPYAPPAGMPPGYAARDSFEYEPDSKSPAAHAGYDYGYSAFESRDSLSGARPGSSRHVQPPQEGTQRRDSNETLRGMEEPTKGRRTSDEAPRI